MALPEIPVANAIRRTGIPPGVRSAGGDQAGRSSRGGPLHTQRCDAYRSSMPIGEYEAICKGGWGDGRQHRHRAHLRA